MCIPVAPSKPVLLQPALNGKIIKTPFDFRWSVNNNGTICKHSTFNMTYNLFIGSSPSSLAFYATSLETVFTLNDDPINGTVYWRIDASNGEASASSDYSSFFYNQCTDSSPNVWILNLLIFFNRCFLHTGTYSWHSKKWFDCCFHFS